MQPHSIDEDQQTRSGRAKRVLDGISLTMLPLALAITALLFLQWPLRSDAVGAGSIQANDMAQWLFALYVAVAINHAHRRSMHLAARPDLALVQHGRLAWLRRIGAPMCVLPWSLFPHRKFLLACLQFGSIAGALPRKPGSRLLHDRHRLAFDGIADGGAGRARPWNALRRSRETMAGAHRNEAVSARRVRCLPKPLFVGGLTPQLIGWHNPASPVPRAPGVSRSEIKEEPKAGDIRGGRYPVASARALTRIYTWIRIRIWVESHGPAVPVPSR